MQSPRHSHQVVQCTRAALWAARVRSGSGVDVCASVFRALRSILVGARGADGVWMIAAHDGKLSLLRAMLCVSSLSGD